MPAEEDFAGAGRSMQLASAGPFPARSGGPRTPSRWPHMECHTQRLSPTEMSLADMFKANRVNPLGQKCLNKIVRCKADANPRYVRPRQCNG